MLIKRLKQLTNIELIIAFIGLVYTLSQIYNILNKLKIHTERDIELHINDSINYAIVVNKNDIDNECKLYKDVRKHFNLTYEKSLFNLIPINEHRLHRLFHDRLLFIKANKKN